MPRNIKADANNANWGTTGFNIIYALNNGNRGKQMNPTWINSIKAHENTSTVSNISSSLGWYALRKFCGVANLPGLRALNGVNATLDIFSASLSPVLTLSLMGYYGWTVYDQREEILAFVNSKLTPEEMERYR
jgi:hypothetical protein